ncbi:XTP/dITP diphosphatase [soil metagenome]
MNATKKPTSQGRPAGGPFSFQADDMNMSGKDIKLLVATGNIGKLRELRQLLAHVPVTLLSLNEVDAGPEVEETGTTFDENAVLKAIGYSRRTGLLTMADDSGLAVDALGGAPGVFSARYGSEYLGYPEKMKLLLDEIDLADAGRRARFVCSIALSSPAGEMIFTSQGVCEGRIAEEPRGSLGFGYDPIFIPDGHDGTFGELSADVKAEISHRARAVEKFVRYFLDFIEVRLDRTIIGL